MNRDKPGGPEIPIPNPVLLAVVGAAVLIVAPWVAGVWSDPSVATVLPVIVAGLLFVGVVVAASVARRRR